MQPASPCHDRQLWLGVVWKALFSSMNVRKPKKIRENTSAISSLCKLNRLMPGGAFWRALLWLTAAVIFIPGLPGKADVVVFDNVSDFENGVFGAGATSTGSTPNTFMGDGYMLLPGTTNITGFDIFPVNLTSTTYSGLELTIYVWGNVNTGTVNSGSPAFANLLASYTFTASGPFDPGFYYPFEGSPAGSSPGIILPAPLVIPGTNVGLSFNYQGTVDDVNYASANNLTSLISYGTLPSVGGQFFNGYYRNVNSETSGNFISPLRSLGATDQSLERAGFWQRLGPGAGGQRANSFTFGKQLCQHHVDRQRRGWRYAHLQRGDTADQRGFVRHGPKRHLHSECQFYGDRYLYLQSE